MPNWLSSMQQTFEFYSVDPATWRDDAMLEHVKSCAISWDSSAETLGSATIEADKVIGERYIRIYLVTIQNGIRERFPLGTFLVQTPTVGFDGKVSSISMDAYTPLLELKDSMPPLGYSILKNTNVMDMAWSLCFENMRAPVIKTSAPTTLNNDFVASLNDSWLTYIRDLISNANYQFGLDAEGTVLFEPIQDTASLQARWSFDDSNSSILYPEVSIDRDLYGIPNVVEVVYSKGNGHFFSQVKNDNPDSPISTVSRGREVVYRVSDPELGGSPTQEQVDAYANQLIRNLSSLEYKITYKHGYCPVRVGDAVYLNYRRAGLTNVKAKVINQSIRCEPGCPVEETAVFTKDLWGGGTGEVV